MTDDDTTDKKYSHKIYADVTIIPTGEYEVRIRMGTRITRYEQLSDMPVALRKAVVLLRMAPSVEYMEGIGRNVGSHTMWVYESAVSKKSKEK